MAENKDNGGYDIWKMMDRMAEIKKKETATAVMDRPKENLPKLKNYEANKYYVETVDRGPFGVNQKDFSALEYKKEINGKPRIVNKVTENVLLFSGGKYSTITKDRETFVKKLK